MMWEKKWTRVLFIHSNIVDMLYVKCICKELLSIKKEYTQEDYKSGRSNILANYVPSVLPGIF